MRIFFIVLTFVSSFFLLNYYLFDSYIAIIFGLILLCISIFLSLKVFQNKNKAWMWIIWGFLCFFCIYVFLYTQVIENTSIISLNPQVLQEQEILKFTSDNDFKNCLENKLCDENKLFIQDFKIINQYIWDYSKKIDLYVLATMVSSLHARSELLNIWKINSLEKINFDKKLLLKQYFEQELWKLEKYLAEKKIIKNLYINKEQYFQYSLDYYQNIYNLVETNVSKLEREEFMKEKYGYNIAQIFVNRKYFYNLMIPQSHIEWDIVFLEWIEENISKMNNLLKK